MSGQHIYCIPSNPQSKAETRAVESLASHHHVEIVFTLKVLYYSNVSCSLPCKRFIIRQAQIVKTEVPGQRDYIPISIQ